MCWFSRTQKCVTLSTTEDEYVALADTIRGAMFMRLWSFIFSGVGEAALRFSRITRGQGICHKNIVYVESEAHRRAVPLFDRAYFQGGVCNYVPMQSPRSSTQTS